MSTWTSLGSPKDKLSHVHSGLAMVKGGVQEWTLNRELEILYSTSGYSNLSNYAGFESLLLKVALNERDLCISLARKPSALGCMKQFLVDMHSFIYPQSEHCGKGPLCLCWTQKKGRKRSMLQWLMFSSCTTETSTPISDLTVTAVIKPANENKNQSLEARVSI